MEVHNLKPLIVSVLFFALPCERIFIETPLEVDVIGPENVLCVRAYFSPDILQAGAVKGLTGRTFVREHSREYLANIVAS